MGIQTMASQGSGQQSHFQPSSLTRQNSWYSLTLDEVNNQLGDMGKPLGSMNLHELLQTIYTTETKEYSTVDAENTSLSSSLQRQASLTLARGLSGKTVDDVWKEIQQGQKRRYNEHVKDQGRQATLGETTLEDFLVQAGLFAEASSSPAVGLHPIDAVTPQSYPHKFGLSSPSPSLGTLSDPTIPGRKRDASDAYERSMERRLKRKIKNRESAARSRARKQAYHNELVSKVSRLEEENSMLKKEMEVESMLEHDSSPEPKYQLRRTSSATF
ncbi:ABSCISIC ACID-INSENSITIVE 5-like protein 2 [Humulus lupulus]|uniref:ABSCISIC ACID-INSENSITIVE 5-like protein 2 n=1 Tax=Humulus lupulus TaxID=3486 RepID=UPI002B40FB74|nr:ABSCISIC ACID-INSENSITIVE 5-like protein 2 [Humulus lupulus]XP_062082367.1 ABSCISIC ACID-INSENSITIVE 5-like protein 2 [Humulus lupulus]